MLAEAFNQLPEDQRLGMTHAEWSRVKAYNGVVAVALSGTTKPSLPGFLVIDHRGPLKPVGSSDLVDLIGKAVTDPGLMSQYLGSLVSLLEKKA